MSRVKIVVHVPPENADEIRRVLGDAGAGIVGNYTHCILALEELGGLRQRQALSPPLEA